jgi:hypothetical protein
MTISVADAEWVGVPPLFPVTVKVVVPLGVELDVLTVRDEVPPPAIVVGLKEADAPLGRPEALNGTLPVKPLRAVIVTV